MSDTSRKSDREWRQQLSDDQYHVAREHGTEPPFSGKYYNNKAAGIYNCVCCGTPLFRSEEKFDSGTGWPSYWAPVNNTAIKSADDHTHGMRRTEVRCANCDAHLGHVFDDGPAPTGLRYCINSVVLDFIPTDKDNEATDT